MKKSSLTPVLINITFGSAILSFVLVVASFYYARQAAGLRAQAMFIANNRPLVNNLAVELLEYSKRNPAIDPILYSTGIKQSTTPPSAPAARPAAK